VPRVPGRVLTAIACLCTLGADAAVAVAGSEPVRVQATSTPPPTPVPPFGSPSPFPTELHTAPPSVEPPTIEAAGAILLDPATLQVVFALAPDDRRPIASLTKVMTAIVVLDRVEDLSEEATVGPSAADEVGSGLGLRVGERISVEDLLYGLLLGSANDAAVALAEHVAGTEAAFATLMDARATELGLRNTDFEGATGLDDHGFSTARDVAVLFASAMALPAIQAVESSRFHDIESSTGIRRHIQNRNVLLWLLAGATGGKTGFTTPAGYCLAASADRNGRSLVVSVLGAPRPAFDAAATLLEYGFDAFVEVPLLRQGQGVGTIDVPGGTLRAVAVSDLQRLVRVDLIAAIERRFDPEPEPSPPIAAGDVVGSVTVLAGGEELGTVDAVVAPSPRVRPAPAIDQATPPLDFWSPLRVLVRAAASAFL
jgi:D-alanyl-D-alanine carboxypeptidase (penicillin-binding protein 5/6)